MVERHVVGGCDLCLQICPHGAIKITDKVEISDDCTGCGLCVQECPSGALEYDLLPTLAALKDQGLGEKAAIKCSKVPGPEPTLPCLARISVAELMASSAWTQTLSLIHGNCANCNLGSLDVPRNLQKVIEKAALYGQKNAQMVQSDENKAVNQEKNLSRREAMGSFWSKTRENLANLIPENPLPGVSATIEIEKIPLEWSWRRKALRFSEKAYWPHPIVNEDCIMCPVCENVCPTDAIERKRLVDGNYQLFLEVNACTGCNACVVSCPPDAMELEKLVEKTDLDQKILLFSNE